VRVRKLAAALAAALPLTAVAACGGGQASDGNTLTYWATNQGQSIADDQKVLNPILQRFQQETGVKVDLEVVTSDTLYNRILTAVSSGQGPDVLNIGNTWSASLQATGAFLPFDDKAMQAIGGKDKFVAASLAATGAAGQTPTSVPLLAQTYSVIYSKKAFTDAGITAPPKTWDEFLTDAKKLTKDTNGDGTPDQWGLTLPAGSPSSDSHLAFILGRQQGGALFDAGGKPTFDSAQQLAAARQAIDLMATDKIVSPSNAEFTTKQQAISDLVQGKAAMYLGQTSTLGILDTLGFKDYGVATVPVPATLPPGGKNTMSMAGGINISVFGESKNTDAALKFVNFMTSTQTQLELSKGYRTLPVVKDAYADPALADPVTQTYEEIQAQHSEPMPQLSAEGQMETLVGGAYKQLFAKAATGQPVTDGDIRAALDSAQQQMKAAG
jgi:multiple sugar transport system substrate-binding protein